MTKHEALTLALEILKAAYVPADLDEQRERAITELEALAQPEQDLVEKLKSVALQSYAIGYKDAQSGDKMQLAQPEQEPLAYAGVKVWVGNQQVVRLLTQTELHYAVEPWLLVELNALKCVAALKEKNT